MDRRVVRVYPDGKSWLLEVYEDWETMTEDQRQEYIYDAAMDNGKIGAFEYDEPERFPSSASEGQS